MSFPPNGIHPMMRLKVKAIKIALLLSFEKFDLKYMDNNATNGTNNPNHKPHPNTTRDSEKTA